LDYVIEPVPIDLPLLHPNKTRLTHIACGRAHTVIVTDNEGGAYTTLLAVCVIVSSHSYLMSEERWHADS